MTRLIVYATFPGERGCDDYVSFALAGLRAHADKIIVVTGSATDQRSLATLSAVADDVVVGDDAFSPSAYADALAGAGQSLNAFDEIVLTGDSWFGPLAGLEQVFTRMADARADFWTMIEDRGGALPAAAYQGAAAPRDPWIWTAITPALLRSRAWEQDVSSSRAPKNLREAHFAAHLREEGFSEAIAFSADDFGNDNPALYSPDLLIEAGAPLLSRVPFSLYPPFLQQHAIIGRDIAATLQATGYPMPHLWQHLARTTAPKALNTAAGMLEIVTGVPEPAATSPRVVVVAHISDMDGAGALLRRLSAVPPGYDLVVTTPDGRKAQTITRLLARDVASHAASVDVRVTPSRRGRDMADFFVGCRDVLLDDRYDLVIKVHCRPARRKTLNMRRYFRRYQLDNLLASQEHVKSIFAMFEREPGLGLVFPPMMHIGFATMGRAGRHYHSGVSALDDELGIHVPLDSVSPLAPLGGMWVGRPEALRPLAVRRWLFRDYGKAGRARYYDLARLQERVVVRAAAEAGFHSRTVLTPEHAAISHTALEFKSDELFSTIKGYPVDAIGLIHRAGPTGRGGVVGLSRMYLRLNHRILSKVALPVLDGAQWVYSWTRALLGEERFIDQLKSNRWEGDDL